MKLVPFTFPSPQFPIVGGPAAPNGLAQWFGNWITSPEVTGDIQQSVLSTGNGILDAIGAARDYATDRLAELGQLGRDTLDRLGDFGDYATDYLQDLFPESNDNTASLPQYVKASDFTYYNADLSKLYGMDKNTAFQEALSNTAYQRAVRDMQAAGLNPAALFGGSRANSASGVSFIGNSYAGSSGSGSGDDKLFASDTYGMIAGVAGLATAIITKKPQNFWLGQQAAQGVMQTLNVLDRKFGK